MNKIPFKQNEKYIFGIDEVGRGPVAGPVTTCVFAHPDNDEARNLLLDLFEKQNLKDSKKLTEKKREEIYNQLISYKQNGLCSFAVTHIPAPIIDAVGIVQCIRESISQNFVILGRLGFQINSSNTFLDGSLPAELGEVIVKGDEKVLAIALASIVAKVERDKLMNDIHEKNPELQIYNFNSNAGYGTKSHLEAIQEYGISEFHRRSFLNRYLN
jgi:ribonuclease HII